MGTVPSRLVGRATMAWSVAPQPRLVVGRAVGAAEYELFSVADARLLSDGRLAVSLAQPGEVRIYDGTGSYVQTIGRRGHGPGEFARAGGPPIFMLTAPTPTGGAGPRRDPEALVAFDPATERADTIVELTGREVYIVSTSSARNRNWVLFGRSSIAAVRSADLVYGDTDAFEIRIADLDGAVRSVIRKAHSPVEVSTAEVERERSERFRVTDTTPPELRELRRLAASVVPAHRTLPAFGRILVDAADNLWIETPALPGEHRQLWHVVRNDGVWLGDVETPADLAIHQVGRDFIVGSGIGDWDSPFVAVYELRK
jgi:hypothetical protein